MKKVLFQVNEENEEKIRKCFLILYLFSKKLKFLFILLTFIVIFIELEDEKA